MDRPILYPSQDTWRYDFKQLVLKNDQLRARITELEQLAEEMADALECAMCHTEMGDKVAIKSLSRYREVIGEVK